MTPPAPSILLVEDQPNTRLLISFILKKAGFNVIEADNGLKAFEQCLRNPPDLILSDIMMPVMNGIEFREKLLDNTKLQTIPFIFLTARAQAHEIIQGEHLSPQAYITKPAEPAVIVDTVRKHLPDPAIRQ